MPRSKKTPAAASGGRNQSGTTSCEDEFETAPANKRSCKPRTNLKHLDAKMLRLRKKVDHRFQSYKSLQRKLGNHSVERSPEDALFVEITDDPIKFKAYPREQLIALSKFRRTRSDKDTKKQSYTKNLRSAKEEDDEHLASVALAHVEDPPTSPPPRIVPAPRRRARLASRAAATPPSSQAASPPIPSTFPDTEEVPSTPPNAMLRPSANRRTRRTGALPAHPKDEGGGIFGMFTKGKQLSNEDGEVEDEDEDEEDQEEEDQEEDAIKAVNEM